MSAAADPERSVPPGGAVVRLVVRNHAGVMSHVCGLFARRGFNVDSIFCLPIDDGVRSVILLLVHEDERLEQMIRQLGKLEDVLTIARVPEARAAFATVADQLASYGRL
jgi:acetolactate synthase-1/3 small subunit